MYWYICVKIYSLLCICLGVVELEPMTTLFSFLGEASPLISMCCICLYAYQQGLRKSSMACFLTYTRHVFLHIHILVCNTCICVFLWEWMWIEARKLEQTYERETKRCQVGMGRVSEYMRIKVEEGVLGGEWYKWRQEAQGYRWRMEGESTKIK